jgi:hypothetical protein
MFVLINYGLIGVAVLVFSAVILGLSFILILARKKAGPSGCCQTRYKRG